MTCRTPPGAIVSFADFHYQIRTIFADRVYDMAEVPWWYVPGYLAIKLPLVILGGVVLALPFLDLVLAFVRRTYAGRWWFVADKQHLHHRLLERGHSQRRAVLLMYGWSALVSFGVIALGLVGRSDWQPLAVAGLLLVFAAVLLVITLGRPVDAKEQARRGESLR